MRLDLDVYSTKSLPYLSGVSAAARFTAGGPLKEDVKSSCTSLPPKILATKFPPSLMHDMSQCLESKEGIQSVHGAMGIGSLVPRQGTFNLL